MRVLVLSNEHGLERSGSAYAYRLDKLRCALQQQGVQTEFLSLREQPVGRPILAQSLNLPFIRRKVADYDLIHAGGDAAYAASLLKPFARGRVVYDVHGDTLNEARLKWASGRGMRSAYWVVQAAVVGAVARRTADYFLAVSKPMQRRLMEESHVPADRIGLVRNGVDLQLFSSPPGDSTNGFTVCYSGGFQAWQGVDSLIDAVELLPRDKTRLKIIGFTQHDGALRSAIARRLGDRVDLEGRLTQSELVSHWTASQFLIIPRSRHRAVEVALPTKFAEYLASGKPVIVCNVDETADLVRRYRCGLVSEPGPRALAETLRFASELSREELRQMGQNARYLAETEFSWDVIGRKYADLLSRWRRNE